MEAAALSSRRPSDYSACVERLLRECARAAGLELGEEQLASLRAYLELLERWGARINLTADPTPGAVIARQLPDAFHLAQLLGSSRAGPALDAGAGAGLVGLPLAVLIPGLELTLVEANGRKCAFLRQAVHELRLQAEVRAERLEALGERFPLALSRATWTPEEWLVRGARVLEPGGELVVFSRARPVVAGFLELRGRRYVGADGGERWLTIWRPEGNDG